ncbi:MAG: hypothetical protein KAT05_11730 [Spirochaetes bacterium]|nr:hypothetical protein [Spirochaetota bacterium]
MPELDDETKKDVCIKCNGIILEKNKLNNYPSEFSTYLCPQCGFENEWWILKHFDKGFNRKSIVRALSFEAYLNGNEMVFDQIIQYINKKYIDENISEDSIQDAFNNLFEKVLEPKNIEATRCPLNRLHDEKFNKIVISQNNKFEDFFEKRILRQWDLKYLQLTDLEKLNEAIKKNGKIRFENRWSAAIDYFTGDHFIKP